MMPGRLDQISGSATMRMKARVAALRAKGADVIDLTIGEPDFDTPAPVKKAAMEAIENNLTRYTSSQGIPLLREEISGFLRSRKGVKAGPERIIATPGGKQGIFYVFASILNPGDEVLLPEPCWVSYADIVRLNGGAPVPVPSSAEDAFVPSMAAIKRAATKRTRAIIINNPVNPTGAFYESSRVEEILGFCRERNVVLVADEIYSDIIFDGLSFRSAAESGDPSVVLVGGFSKMAAMTGWRIGYVVAGENIIRDCVKMQEQTATCPCSISQHAAIAAIRNYDSFVPDMVRRYQQRRDLFVEGINSVPGLGCFRPRGAFYLFADFRKFGFSSEKATDFLLEKALVSSVPGCAFGKSGEGYVRFSFATSEGNISRAVENIRKVLA